MSTYSPFSCSICVVSKKNEFDSTATELLQKLNKSSFLIPFQSSIVFLRSYKIYHFSGDFSDDFLHAVGHEVIVDSVVEDIFIQPDYLQLSSYFSHSFQYAVEVGYKAGISDNEAASLCDGIRDFADFSEKSLPLFVAHSGYGFFLNFSDENVFSAPKQLQEWKKDLFETIIGKSITQWLELRTQKDFYGKCFFTSSFSNCNLQNFSKDKLLDHISNKSFLDFNPLKKYDFIPLDFGSKNYCEALQGLSNEKGLSLLPMDLKKIKDYFVSVRTNEKRKNNIVDYGFALNILNEGFLDINPSLRQEMKVHFLHLAKENKNTSEIKEEDFGYSFPAIGELEVIAQTWSEHCKHRIFAATIEYSCDGEEKEKITINSLYRFFIKDVTEEIKKERPDLLSVFSDNAGIVAFGENHAIACKVETHNAPSAIDPFGGAATGIVGVNRDIIGAGLGFDPICNFDVLCFGPIRKKQLNKKNGFSPSLFHLKGVHCGIKHGGNESGIPTVAGAMVFHDSYTYRPLVYCGTVGIAPKEILKRSIVEKKICVGDNIAMVGGRVGRDGIHGATVSSGTIGKDTPASVVQVADPITQKKMLNFILRARDLGLFRAVTDNGAGGLSSSVGEMALLSGGAWLQLENVPLKEEGLEPWEILVSESQERMTLAVPEDSKEAIAQLAEQMGCEIFFIGLFTKSGYFCATYENQSVCKLELDFLHNGAPQMHLKAHWSGVKKNEINYDSVKFFKENLHDYGSFLKNLLSSENIASKEKLVRQFDHEVKSQTVLKPFDGPLADAPMDAAVMRPLSGSDRGVVVSIGIAPRYAEVDAYAMAAASIDEAVRGAVAVGADLKTIVGLDDFCWPDPLPSIENPDSQKKLAQLVRACQALKDICLAYQLPIVSGKDSMKNDYCFLGEKKSIVPTLLFVVVSQIENCQNIVTSTFKKEKNPIYILGRTYHEMGLSEANALLTETFPNEKFFDTRVPFVRAVSNKILYENLSQAIRLGYVGAAHDISDGGLAVALAESAFGGVMGAQIDLSKVDIFPASDDAKSAKNKNSPSPLSINDARLDQKYFSDDFSFIKLFSESQGRFVVEVIREYTQDFEKLMKDSYFKHIGFVDDGDFLCINDGKKKLLKESLSNLKLKWQSTFSSDIF